MRTADELPFKPLNLPRAPLNISYTGGVYHVFDIFRKKKIVLTPEEWVRQHLLHFLISDMKYPKSMFKVESGLLYNKMQKRTDILCYDRNANPFLLIECKSPSVAIKPGVLEQLSAYNQKIKALYISVSNGLVHYVYKIDYDQKSYQSLTAFPTYHL
ncbi:MAG: type I restriction enzyme HsdR N-terminal domain-containing protein [Cyclobacteriaceae bacterium]